MENTRIICYGSLKEIQQKIEEEFDWKAIADASPFMKKADNTLDTFIITYKGPAIQEETAEIHTSSRMLTIDRCDYTVKEHILPILEQAVSDVLNCRCAIRFNPVSDKTEQFTVLLFSPEQRTFHGLRTGSLLTFGSYAQRENRKKQPVQWRVLDISESEAFLITEKSVMISGYCDAKKVYGNPWYTRYGNCLAREMCNGVFYHKAFDSEKDCILPQRVDGVKYGPVCTDEVFLLSEEQARLFFRDASDRRTMPSDDLLSLEAETPEMRMSHGYEQDKDFVAWWLLPEDCGPCSFSYPKAVWPDGHIQFHGRNVGHSDFTIRPCICVSLDERFRDIIDQNKKKGEAFE